MTLEEYNKNLRTLAEEAGGKLTERVIIVGAISMLANIKNRIFRDGLDSSGSKIGNYSTEPYYATKDQFIKKSAFKPGGKRGYKGERLVKTGDKKYKVKKEKLKSMYLKEGYKEFRDIQGRQTNTVNFFMKGDLSKSYILQQKEKEALIGFDDAKESLVRQGLEDHFKQAKNTIFPATEEEKRGYTQEVINELKIVQSEIINGIK